MNEDIKQQLMNMLLDKYIYKFEAECALASNDKQHQIDELEKVLKSDFQLNEYDLASIRHEASYLVYEGFVYETN